MAKETLSNTEIKKFIKIMTDSPGGFEVYAVTKSEPKLKKMGFVEDESNNLRHKLRDAILLTLKNKYGAEEAEYVSADRIADNQRKFYVIPTSAEYDPFAVLKSEAGIFSKTDSGDATGIAFLIRAQGKSIWAYQHLWSIMIPNKTEKYKMGRVISNNRGDLFEEITDPIISFSDKIDLLIVNDYIISSDYNLLQKSFGFQDYIRARADKTIKAIKDKGLVANADKLENYVQRGNGTSKYAKKMMRIADSKVLGMNMEILWENIHNSSRWNGKIREENGQFVLDNYKQVEYLIDLLDERYTRSDITGEEYDTEVKQVAKPVEQETSK